jgi:hypothetical protein
MPLVPAKRSCRFYGPYTPVLWVRARPSNHATTGGKAAPPYRPLKSPYPRFSLEFLPPACYNTPNGLFRNCTIGNSTAGAGQT